MNRQFLRLVWQAPTLWTVIRMVTLIATLSVFSPASSQSFKGYTDLPGDLAPMKLTVNEITAVGGVEEYVLVGDYKSSKPPYQAGAFLIRADHTGQEKLSRLLYTNFPNGTNGVVGRSVAIDPGGNYYLGGASVQNVFLGGGSERTISMLNAKGLEIWSRMQPNYSFESVIFDESSESILTLSGPVGSANPNTDIMVNRLSLKGAPLGSVTLNTPTTDIPVKIMALPGGEIIALGVYDELSPQTLLLRLDKNLDKVWAYAFSDPALDVEPRDMVVHSDGYYAITGQATSPVGESFLYLMGVDELGKVLFFNKYESPAGGTLLSGGITTFTGLTTEADSGFLIAGTHILPGSGRKRGFVLKTDSFGKVIWSHNYSNFTEITDYDRDETLEDIAYFPHSRYFVATGNFTQSLQGVVNQRRIVTVKADADYGLLSEAYNTCAGDMDIVLAKSGVMNVTSVGATVSGGSMFGFTYNIGDMATFTDYCAWPTVGVVPPKGPSIGDVWVNPGSGEITFRYNLLETGRNGVLEIMDILGRRVYISTLDWRQTEVRLNLSEHARGAYLMRIHSGENVIHSEKFLLW
ncbi:MAG: T9SS type A sorting domain-containing protein [Bacteroidia bacterium]